MSILNKSYIEETCTRTEQLLMRLFILMIPDSAALNRTTFVTQTDWPMSTIHHGAFLEHTIRETKGGFLLGRVFSPLYAPLGTLHQYQQYC